VLTVAWLQKENAERKGIFDLLRAVPLVCSRNPDVRFIIAGEHGSAYPDLMALARDLGVERSVEFPGVVSKTQKVDLMRRCRIYVQPSVYEGFGLAILEAMGCGAAVIAASAGAVPEVVGDAGLLVDHCTPDAIAEAVSRLLGDEPLCGSLGRRAGARARESFPYERRRRELQEVILGLLQSRG
jgi:glycosyltransferase involved in cell wall biosynthesis